MPRTDAQLLDWMDQRLDNLLITRDQSAGTKVTLDFCYSSTGCPGIVEARTVREAINHAAEKDDAATGVDDWT